MVRELVQFRDRPHLQLTLHEVAERFGFTIEQADAEFGVIATDPDDGLYTVLVEEPAAALMARQLAVSNPHDPAVGRFSNPVVEPGRSHGLDTPLVGGETADPRDDRHA